MTPAESPAELSAPASYPSQHPRQRASQACVMCNSRKIKCDALRAYPCTRCREAKLNCVLRTSNRGKTRRQPTKSGAGKSGTECGTPTPDETQKSLSLVPGLEEALRMRDQLSPQSVQDDHTLSEAAHNLRAELESLLGQTPESANKGNLPTVHLSENGPLSYLIGVLTNRDQAKSSNFHVQLDSTLPVPVATSYKQAFSRLDRQTSSFLISKSVFAYPPLAVMDQIVDIFFKYVDPHIPLLDKTEFMHEYRNMSVSPLLLHSVLFVGAHYADNQLLAEAGASSRRDMANSYFEKAKLLADHELEQNQIALVQSFVLLAHQWDNWTQDRGPRYWLSRAVNVALLIGIHRKPQALALSKEKDRLWRRVLIVLLTRDRLMAAAVGAPMILNEKNIDRPPLLTEEDFDDDHEDEKIAPVPKRPLVMVRYSLNIQTLGTLMGEVLERQYTAQGTPDGTSSSLYIETQLDIYDRDLPTVAQIRATKFVDMPDELRVLPPLGRAGYLLLAMLYHRPLYEKHNIPAKKYHHRAKLFDAAREVHGIMVYICEQELMLICPLWFCTCLFHTVGVLLAEYGESLSMMPQDQKCDAPILIQDIIDTLQKIEETWHMAGWGKEIFRNALSRLEERARARHATSESSELPRYVVHETHMTPSQTSSDR